MERRHFVPLLLIHRLPWGEKFDCGRRPVRRDYFFSDSQYLPPELLQLLSPTPRMSIFQKYWAVYLVMLRNSLIREMNFKLNFLLWMIVESLWFVGQLVFIEVIFNQVNQIGDWTKWQMVLLVGTHQIISQIFQGFFFTNLVNLPELVRTGKLDFILLQPVDGQFATSVRQFGLDSIVNALVGVGIVTYSLSRLHVVPGVNQIVLYLATMLLGVTIHYSILFSLGSVSFWIVRSQGLIWGYYNIMNLARYPDVVFKGAVKFVFSWLIPVIVVTNVPARVLMNASATPWWLIVHLLLASALMLFFSRILWRVGLNRYSSASS
jgi:ABC-2 type transport system permease protein